MVRSFRIAALNMEKQEIETVQNEADRIVTGTTKLISLKLL